MADIKERLAKSQERMEEVKAKINDAAAESIDYNEKYGDA